MSTVHQGSNEEEKKNINNVQPYQRVADRVQQWNRAIPEAGYITLGTIRYGVRLSNDNNYPHRSSSTKSFPLSSNNTISKSISSSNISGNQSCSITPSRSGSSDRSTNSSNNHSCCCIGSSNIALPWTTNYARTKISAQSSNSAKNRILSTSQSSSFSLAAMSAPDPPSPPAADAVSSPISTTLNLANRDLQIHKNNKNNNLTSNTNESSCQTITTTTTTSATTASTEPSISSPSSTFQIVSKFNRQNSQSGNDIQTVKTPSLSSSSVLKTLPHCLLPAEIESPPIEIISATQSLSGVVVSSSQSSCTNNSISVSHSDQHRSCNSISYSTINCCKLLNSSSSSSSSAVSVEQCRDRELSSISSSSIPKSSQSSSICCYTIASQSRTISKQLNRSNSNLKRIPRSVAQQHSFNPSSSKSSSTFSPSSLANKNPLSPSSSRKIPPPIPPRPHHTTSTTTSAQLSPKSGEDDSVNPIHFHRKLQKFEQQCSNNNNSGNINQQQSQHNTQHHGNCSGNRFEFFGCFSSNDQVSSSSDRSSDYCSSSNSEINYIPPNKSSSLSGDNRVILPVKKFNNTKNLSNINKNNCGVNKSNNQQNAVGSVQLSKHNLRSNNNSSLQDVISIDNNDNNIDHIRLTNDLIKVKSLDEVPKILSSSTTASTAASVVIRKLTPKLTRKSFKFGDHITRGDSEDRLINDQQQQQQQQQHNQNKLLLNRIGVGFSGGNNSFDYDSDIGFIDSSGGDGDHSSSLSDIDPISIKNSNKLSSIQQLKNLKSIKVTSSLSVQNDVPSFIPIKNSKNYCNLSFDSVPKILNSINSDNNKNLNNNYNIINNSNYTQYDNNNYENNNIKLIHNNTQNINQNLLIKDLYDSLTDIDETSTISCLSEDNICCDCNLNTSISDKSLDICHLKKSHTIGCFSERRNQDQEFYSGGSSGCSNYSDNNNYQQQQQQRINTKKLREQQIYSETSSPPLLPLHPPPLSPNIGETGVGIIPTTITEESIVGYVKGPVFKRVPAIESFGYIGKNQLHGRSQQDRELIMEKRRNTLDRLQRLGFGRRSSPSPTQQEQTKTRKSYEKSERLRELTELLKGNRKSPTPPPIPPPRKLRHANSLEKTLEHEPISSFSGNHSDDILPMDEEVEEDNIPDPVKRKSDEYSHLKNKKNDGSRSAEILTNNNNNNNHHHRSPSPFLNTLKPNTSISNLESIIMKKDKSKSPSPSPTPKHLQLRDDDLFSKLPRAESKTIIGSYTQKTIPFRSASFSQIDYSSTSGKYIKSALGAIRDKLRSNKESSVVDNTNLTLPRKKDDLRNQSTRKKYSLENYEIDKDNNRIGNNNSIKKTELSINLKFEQDNEKFSLEDIVNPPDVILEEDCNSSEIDRHSINQIKDEDIFETEKSLINKSEIDSLDIIPQTVEEKIIEEKKYDDISDETFTMNLKNRINSKMKMKNENLDEQQEASLAVLTEEDIPLESPPENFLQTATTCLIPVPVYECVAGEWNAENTSEQWLHMAPEEIGLNPEICVPLNSSTEIKNSSQNDSEVNKSNETVEQEKKNKQQQQQQQKDASELKDLPLLAIELLPTISVSQESLPMASLDDKQIEINSSNTKKENTSISDTSTEKVTASAGEAESKNIEDTNFKLPEYVEVKKRYSNDDMKVGERCQSTDSCVIRGSEEKRRIDKSRRRKGMYIQWPTIDKNVDLENSDWSETPGQTPVEFVGGRPTLDFTKVDFSKINQTLDSATEPISSASSRPSECKGTPGSLGSYDPLTPESDYSRPFWPKGSRRSSLSCQSSEEKDDSSPVVPYNQRSVRNAIFLRTDSTSDNESDRTRASPSPAPGEQDFRRYSKRPLRGPYGQMLEAEMKKPAKMYYDEILEELKTPESSTPGSLSPPTRNYSTPSHSFEDNNSIQQSKSGRNRRNNVAYLPIPIHTRAASTPSQMETPTTTTASIDGFTTHHKRYQSTSDTISHLSESPSTYRSKVADAKKFSLDSNRDRSPKRASSEVPDTKHQHAKRSSSTASEKQQKRSLDEMRLSQVSRTPSERSMGSAESGKHSGNLMPTPELLAELLKGSSERLISEQRQQIYADTRTHVVQEIFRNEQSYVDSLQTVVMKYLNVLKTPEYAGMIDSKTVDEIFFMVPEILNIHEKFLNELKARLDSWDLQQKVGDAFHETFSKTEVLETYTAFVNNCNRAKDAIKTTSQQRPSFARFLEATAREHKGKLSLDNLLIKPVQKFPNYEMLFTRLIKHTDIDHPDQKPLQDVLKLVHDILVHINCKEKEVLENGQREATLRELEGIIEGITELVAPERHFLLFDLVSMPSGQGARKERGFFLFSDLLVITSIKRRSGTIRKPNTITCPGSVASTLDTNKYKFLTKVPLDSLEVLKTKDENVRRIMNEIEQLADDCNKLQQIAEITSTLKYPHQLLEETIRDLHREVQRQLSERQSNDTQLNVLELTVNSSNGSQKLTIVFNKAEKRSQWEEAFNEAKQKLAASLERHPIPEFLMSIPIRKTRAGLQFTCAAPTLSSQKDVWVCNSDGYVGQVCVLSIVPEPNVTSCNGVCNARILCVASVPAAQIETKTTSHVSLSVDETSQQCHSPRSSNSSNCQASTTTTTIGNLSIQGGSSVNVGSGNGGGGNTENKKISNQSDNGSDIQLDSNSSSDDSEPESGNTTGAGSGESVGNQQQQQQQERIPSPAPTSVLMNTSNITTATTTVIQHQHQDSNPIDEADNQQSTMWLGTEDGCIHVYNCTDNIRIKKNKIKIQHVSAVYSILYLDNRVFVALANGDICVYLRENGGWNTNSPLCISIGSVTSPVNKLLNVHGKLWCSIQGIIKVLDTKTLQVENQIQISSDSKPITNMVVSNNYVWISIQNSAHIKCFHSKTHDLVFEVNLAPSVNKMLSNCDDIIRQHKAACLRVTSLLACKDLIWIGTSAGVLLTIPAQGYNNATGQNQNSNSSSGNINSNNMPILTGIPHGHTGHVRFLAYVDTDGTPNGDGNGEDNQNSDTKNNRHSTHAKTKSETGNVLIISGGDGYEDFRCSGANTMSEIAGREDSTNHLLLWQM